MKQIKYLFLLLAFTIPSAMLAFTIPSAVQAEQEYDGLYVFGDSLSDTGNLASVTGDFPQPPYYHNRVSNGLLAIEIMAGRLGLPLATSYHLIGPAVGNNYSVAGASSARNESIDLNTQVALFMANHGGVAPAGDLYVMIMGGNDIRKARDTADWPAAVQHVQEAARNIATQIQVLAATGAKHWLVLNAPDIGRIPETHLVAEATGLTQLPARATELSKLFNRELKHRLQSIEDESGLEIQLFDLFKLFSRIVDKSDKLGFTNSTDACFSSEQGQFNAGCDFGYNFDRYIFFDEIHPTARVHAMVGEAMYHKVSDEDEQNEHVHGAERKHRKGVESAMGR